MGRGRRARSPPPLGADERGVSPVVGTILVLGITILGIAGIMAWGAPTIARIQAQNAQLGMVGELEDLRSSMQELSVPDHSRFPTVVIPAGSLNLEAGSRYMVTADRYADCRFEVTEWSDSDTNVDVAVSGAGCAAADTAELHQVSGSNTILQATVALGADKGSSAFSSGDWYFVLTDGAATPTVYSEAWLLSTDRISWGLTAGSNRNVYLDGGAVFSSIGNTIFLDKDPALGDSTFGTGYVGFWLRTLDADQYESVTGQGSHQVYLSLTGNHLRIDQPDVYSVRYGFYGSLSEPWCNSLLDRNGDLSGASYAEVGGAGCSSGDAYGVRSVLYTVNGGADPFEYRLLEAQIHASLAG